jgi:hypothetical protein
LQDALKDYPEVSARLQEALKRTGLRPGMSREQRTDQFEAAIGLLEGGLGMFMAIAAQELRDAEATGDAALISKLKEKEMLMSGCRGGLLRDSYGELADFFDQGLN